MGTGRAPFVYSMFLSSLLAIAWVASAQCPFPFTPLSVLPSNTTYHYSSAAFKSIFAQLDADIDTFLTQTTQNSVSSYAVAVVHENRTIYTSGLATTPFRCASITKLFTTLGAFMLRERGVLSLDDPVKKFLPDFSIINPFGNHDTTLRELMAHVSGFPIQLCPFGLTCTDDEATILKQIAGMELARPPWSGEPVYSNMGITVLGHAWEKATSPQVSWWEFIKENVVKTLGMVNTGIDLTHVALAPNYDPLARQDLGWSGPAAQMYSTAEDLAKFTVFLLNGSPTLISDASRREWIRPTKLYPDGKSAYGMPWELRKLASNISSEFIVTKAGDINGFRSQIAFHQSTKLGVVVLTVYDNIFFPGPDTLADSILTTLIPQVQLLNDAIIGASFDGLYTCAPSPGFASPTLNYTVAVLGGSISITSNSSRGLLATLSLSLQNAGGTPYFAGGVNFALLLKNATETSFWFGDGSQCLWYVGGISAAPDMHNPNTPDSIYTNLLRFDLATQSVLWPAVGANCTKS